MHSVRSSLPLRTLVVLLAVAGTLSGQALPEPGIAAATTPVTDPPAVHEARLEFKFAEGSGAELRAGSWRSRTGVDLSPVLRWLDGAEITPLITVVDWDQLDRWHRRASAVLPEHNRPGHLGLWFRARTVDAAAADALLARLAAEPLIAHAYKEPILYPASFGAGRRPAASSGAALTPDTPSFTAMQLSHDPTPLGHGIRLGNAVLGGRGQGITFYMIEDGWLFDHEDVSQLVSTNVIGPVGSVASNANSHALSGASLVIADRNGYGITGISDQVQARFVSESASGVIPNSYALVLQQSQPGDVVLMVLMVLVPGLGPGTWLPAEFFQSIFDIVLTTTASGVHVCAPAGNGSRSLDDPTLLGRFDRNFRDSGAVIVGASNGALLQRASYCNWGSRVDAHSWGNDVVSCGYGTLHFPNNDPRRSYTAAATGTSSATPHIAGVIAAIQGAAKRQLGAVLSNQQIVTLLHNHGAPTPDGIGRRPDLVAIFDVLAVHDGLRADRADVALDETLTMTLEGSNGIAALFGALAPANQPIGFNRNLHLDPLGAVPLGAYVLGTAGPHFQLTIPANAALHGVELFFQAARSVGSNPLQLTNSCHVTIL